MLNVKIFRRDYTSAGGGWMWLVVEDGNFFFCCQRKRGRIKNNKEIIFK